MTYQETLDYLFSQLPMFQRVGAAAYKADLKNTIALCKILRNPERKFKSIHIAGTNGKGSVSHLVASILQEHGYKTGLYTSPHLKDFRERIRINGKKIPQEKVIDFVETYKGRFENIKPSFFEYTFGMAISYFNEEKVDFAIMETGMGGRLDSTNVVDPLISVITNIGFDHTQFLGDTLEKIAIEKAGIIKENVPVIIGESQEQVKGIFIKTAIEKKTKISFADQIFNTNIHKPDTVSDQMTVDIYKDTNIIYQKLICPLIGFYQQRNIITTIAIIDELNKQGYGIARENIYDGIKKVIENTGIQGRWQVLNAKPLTICDTGHNIDGITQVVKQINNLEFDKLHFVLGMVNDKSTNQVLNILPKNARFYFCKANIPRGLDQNELRKKASKFNLIGNSYDSVPDAFQAANKNASYNDLVFIGGSTFVVAEIL